ncbi:class I SAM-dependent methyltransferase [Calothrix rhizosoleniae]|uniref:class I SAM-dependent methyltransferase n=1 Tax=Calothrix rhizosoleniae TaxID=888997 RepID=UPI000B4A067B|nr:class I SAM-dependent methyltransferase [Calothrix rhizosoleniae]
MTAAVKTSPSLASQMINGISAIKPLANFAKHQARQMIIKRAEKIGVPWTQEVEKLKQRDWESDFAQVHNPQISYPEYYLQPFHAYEKGDLCWEAALEVEVAAKAVHARIWQEAGVEGDSQLRQSYHDIIKAQIPHSPQDIMDLGCSVGMSTFALQAVYLQAQITGVDLSPYFLAIAHYRSQQRQANINWVHAAGESTGIADNSFDLASMFLICHELPQSATREIFTEVRRLLRPGGHLTIMDMNPQAEAYKKMPPYVLTLLKSTEPYMDEYFTLDMRQTLMETGFHPPAIIPNSPRHRTIIARVRD